MGREYDRLLPRYTALAEEVQFALADAIGATEMKVHSISGRIKSRDSALEKAQRKGYTAPFEQMPDVVGARVVCLFADDVPRLRQIVERLFDVQEVEDKASEGPVDAFGYMSLHLSCLVRAEHAGPRYDGIKGLTFEVQCRTLLQDAWANVSHYLAYKGDASIPEHLRKDFHALSGLFYVADKHFELFYRESERSESAAVVEVTSTDVPGELPISRGRVAGLFLKLYPDRVHADSASISEFIEQATSAGYSKLGQLEDVLARALPTMLSYEEVHPPIDETGPTTYSDVGLARLSLAIADPRFAGVAYEFTEEFEEYRAQMPQ